MFCSLLQNPGKNLKLEKKILVHNGVVVFSNQTLINILLHELVPINIAKAVN